MINNVKLNIGNTVPVVDGIQERKFANKPQVLQPAVDRKQSASSAREEVPREEIYKAAAKLNQLMGIIDKRLNVRIDEKSQREVVQVINQENGEVINEFPPKQLIDFLGSFRELIGLVMDKHV